ncbi:hypothetical protein HYC85_010455 [Camellia sinensis]|uniref:Uncharacterized protein n=1 Tax=Camellia sinensis TaxID=4442 RepID=A0A7J7HJT9_CAMSI|nr:hypothetical protein HYC85_010455 [Camellia sinensis]
MQKRQCNDIDAIPTPRLLGYLDRHFATTPQNNQSSSSSSAFSFSLSLSYKYNTACDLEANLSRECAELAAHPQHLHQNLAKLIISWISRSIAAKSTLHKLNLTTMSPYGIQKMMSEDLPQLAMELSRVENIRRYARPRIEARKHLQTRREERQLGLLGKKKLNTGLWAIDELVSPIASRPDWLKIWAKIELKVGRMKLKEESKHERAWLVDTKNEIGSAVDTTTEPFLLYSRENLC